jgi:hypothetical protein
MIKHIKISNQFNYDERRTFLFSMLHFNSSFISVQAFYTASFVMPSSQSTPDAASSSSLPILRRNSSLPLLRKSHPLEWRNPLAKLPYTSLM